MNYSEFENILNKHLTYNKLEIDSNSKETLYEYMKNLLTWNEMINLTAIKDEAEVILKHFVDSIYIKDLIRGKVMDIGSGAGFPGLPLCVVNSDIELTSIDSVNKKINFQKDTIEKLEIKNAEAMHTRAEDLAQDSRYREQYDFTVSRAVANLATLVEYMLPFTKVGGKCICLKGPSYKEELGNAQKAIEVLGGKIESIKEYKISDENERTLIIITKVNKTDKAYPRKQGKPSKEPIK